MTYMNIVGLFLALTGSIFLGITLIKRKSTIRGMSRTMYGGNPIAKKEWLKDRKFGISGILLLIIGFALQLAAQISNI